MSITESTLTSGGYISSWMQFVDVFHTHLDLPWWGAIIAMSAALRVVTIPLFFRSVRTGARIQEATPEMTQFQAALAAAQAGSDKQVVQDLVARQRLFMKERGIRMRDIFLPLLVQTPLFISSFIALRTFAREAHLVPGFMDGGMLWFTALHLPDPYGLIPLTSVAMSSLAIALNPNITGMPQQGLTRGGQRLLFMTLSTLFQAVTLWMPVSLQLSFFMTSATMLLQQALLRTRAVTATLGFPAGWPYPPSKLDEFRRIRDANQSPFAKSLSGMKGVFATFSRVADGKVTAAAPSYDSEPHKYTNMFGLRNVNPPPPPSTPSPSTPNVHLTSSVAVDAAMRAAGTAAGAPSPPAPPELLMNKPSSKKRR